MSLVALVATLAVACPVAADSDLVGMVRGTRGWGLRLREQPGFGQTVLLVVPEGASVKVSGGTAQSGGQEWRQVDYGGDTGWVSADYLAIAEPIPTAAPEATPSEPITPTPQEQPVSPTAVAESVTPTVVPDGDDRADPSSRDGRPAEGAQAVVDLTLSLVGYHYRMGAAGPNAFDCAGLTHYVYAQQGIELGRDAAGQWGQGVPVERGDLRPGDLVFFENTYIWGISHVGIYIGNGQFVHAVDEWTGVAISGLDEGYWPAHYAGARRLLP